MQVKEMENICWEIRVEALWPSQWMGCIASHVVS
jgi:hypothetical protein